MEIFTVHSLASPVNIQSCEAYSNLKKAADILRNQTHLVALIQVINDYAFGNAPLSDEQISSIAEALARNSKTSNQYGIADKYLAALSDYVSILSTELAFSPEQSVQFAYEKYVDRVADSGNVALADFLAERLNSLSMFLSMSRLESVSPYQDW